MKRNLERIEAVGEAGKERLLTSAELGELCALDNMLEHMARGKKGDRDRYERPEEEEKEEDPCHECEEKLSECRKKCLLLEEEAKELHSMVDFYAKQAEAEEDELQKEDTNLRASQNRIAQLEQELMEAKEIQKSIGKAMTGASVAKLFFFQRPAHPLRPTRRLLIMKVNGEAGGRAAEEVGTPKSWPPSRRQRSRNSG